MIGRLLANLSLTSISNTSVIRATKVYFYRWNNRKGVVYSHLDFWILYIYSFIKAYIFFTLYSVILLFNLCSPLVATVNTEPSSVQSLTLKVYSRSVKLSSVKCVFILCGVLLLEETTYAKWKISGCFCI